MGFDRAAVAIRPSSAEAHSLLGLALCRKGDTDLAIAAYQQALALDPKFATARWLNIDFVPAERDGAYRVFDASIDYTSASQQWQLGIFGHNLGNESYYTGGLQQSFVGGLFAANIAPPRLTMPVMRCVMSGRYCTSTPAWMVM